MDAMLKTPYKVLIADIEHWKIAPALAGPEFSMIWSPNVCYFTVYNSELGQLIEW